MNSKSIEIVQSWIKAINERDAERLTELSNSNIKFTGTRGSNQGIDLVRDWLLRVGLTLDSKRIFASNNSVVVEEHGTWRSVETGEFVGEADEAWRFKVENELVSTVDRFDELKDALKAAELQTSDEIEAV